MLVRRTLQCSRQLIRQKPSPGATASRARHASTAAIVKSLYEPVSIADALVHERVLENVGQWSENVALHCAHSGRSYTYAQVDKLSSIIAAGYLRSGLKPGQVVTMVLPNVPEFVLAALGASKAGLVVSTINPLYAPDEILHQLQDSESAMVITFMQKLGDVRAAVGKLRGNKPILAAMHGPTDDLPEGVRSLFEAFNNTDIDILREVKRSPDDLALLLYSSGTTGLPKGVRLTHRNIVSNIAQISQDQIVPFTPTTKDNQDVAACILPFFHVYGLVIGALAFLKYGLKLVTLPKFDTQLYLSTIKEHKVNIIQVVPPIVQFLANSPSVKPSDIDSLTSCTNGAAPLSPSDGSKLLEKNKKLHIGSGYGLTESSPVITAPKTGVTCLESCGYLIPNTELKIIDPDTNELLDPKTPGEICARGPQIMEGYHNNKEATDKTVINGWLHTGDIGYVSEDGRLYIIDRLKELIKVKGFQVAPVELEELLRTHPSVADVGVVGKPDARLGETPVAFVVSKDKKTNSEDLKSFVASKVAEYKQLSEIIYIDEIPKNATGKILRRLLKDKLPKSS